MGSAPSVGERLQKVREILEAQEEQDKKVSDRMGCWCQSHREEKRAYADELRQRLDGLSHDVQAAVAENARLNAELEQHKAELAEGQDSLSKADALREKAATKYSEEHQLTQQSIDQLDGALQALRSNSGHGLSMVEKMRRLLDSSSSGGVTQKGSLLQLRQQLNAASSPEMVYGVLKQMRSTFAANLKDMQEDESLMKSRHDALTSAKAREIESIKKQLVAKQQRVAEGGLAVTRQQEVLERMGKLLEATEGLVAAMGRVCEGRGQASEARHQARQAGLAALASAQAELAGAQLLALGAAARGRAEDLCLLAAGLPEEQWRGRAEAACAAAKNGHLQDAAEAAEALEEDINEALRAASSDAEQCKRAHQEAASQHARAMEDTEVRASVVDSAKQGADAQINEITGQADACQKAKAELAEIRTAQRGLSQGLRADAGRIEALLRTAGAAAPLAASAKLQEVVASVGKLSEAAEALGAGAEQGAQELSRSLDDAARAGAKVLIPLRLMRADAEEAAVSIHEEQEKSAHKASTGPACDLAALTAKVQSLQGHVKQLEDATVNFAWGSLR